jgi:hypothetical protein
MTLSPRGAASNPDPSGPGTDLHVVVILSDTIIAGLTSLYLATQSVVVVVVAAAVITLLGVLVVLGRRR